MSSTGRPIIPPLDLAPVIERNIAKEKRLAAQEKKEADAANSTAILLAMLNIPPSAPIYKKPAKKVAVTLPSIKKVKIYHPEDKPVNTRQSKKPAHLPSMSMGKSKSFS